jgi:hypothetical protein
MISAVTRTASPLLHLVWVLSSMSACAIDTQSDWGSRTDTPPRQFVECGPAFAERCPENSLYRQLPELMTPSDGGDAESQPLKSSPYRKLQVLPRLMIVPAPSPNADDILLQRHPGDPG